jgi:hypothetical protein
MEMKLILLALGTIFLLSFVVAVAYVYAQPIEENWLNVPSHAVNGEIEIYVPIEDNPIPYLRTPISEAQPDLSAIDINFDLKNQSMKFEPNATFSFDSNDRLTWSGSVEVPINNQTFRKIFDLEAVVYNTKQDEYGKVY